MNNKNGILYYDIIKLNPILNENSVFELYVTGRAEWMDKSHRKCLILWHRIQDWAELILRYVSYIHAPLKGAHKQIYCIQLIYPTNCIGAR